jgi:hypothetical protein
MHGFPPPFPGSFMPWPTTTYPPLLTQIPITIQSEVATDTPMCSSNSAGSLLPAHIEEYSRNNIDAATPARDQCSVAQPSSSSSLLNLDHNMDDNYIVGGESCTDFDWESDEDRLKNIHNNVFAGYHFVIANGTKSGLARLRRKIETNGGIVHLNFSKVVRPNLHLVVHY